MPRLLAPSAPAPQPSTPSTSQGSQTLSIESNQPLPILTLPPGMPLTKRAQSQTGASCLNKTDAPGWLPLPFNLVLS